MTHIISLKAQPTTKQSVVCIKQRVQARPSHVFNSLVQLNKMEQWLARYLVVYSMDGRVRAGTESLRMGDYVEWSSSFFPLTQHPQYSAHDAGSLRVLQVSEGMRLCLQANSGDTWDIEVFARGQYAEVHWTYDMSSASSSRNKFNRASLPTEVSRAAAIDSTRAILDALCDVAVQGEENTALRLITSR